MRLPASLRTVSFVCCDALPASESYTWTLFAAPYTVSQCRRTGENITCSHQSTSCHTVFCYSRYIVVNTIQYLHRADRWTDRKQCCFSPGWVLILVFMQTFHLWFQFLFRCSRSASFSYYLVTVLVIVDVNNTRTDTIFDALCLLQQSNNNFAMIAYTASNRLQTGNSDYTHE